MTRERTSQGCVVIAGHVSADAWPFNLAWLTFRATGGRAVALLVEGFSVFGFHIQYWMPIAALIVAVAIAIGLQK
jgi:hypothetical protein